MAAPAGIITLTTDFGLEDHYVGAMKGVVLGINPRAALVDVSHHVPPQDVLHGAYLLSRAVPHFPVGTVHVAVVDPSVGTDRRALLVQTGRESFVLPDNGLLTLVLAGAGLGTDADPSTPFLAPRLAPLPRGWRAVALTNPRYWRHPVSRTFHGRDIFAPVAAHLSLGVPPQELGEPVETAMALHVPPVARSEGTVVGHVVHVDRFGNLITTVPLAEVHPEALVRVAGQTIHGLSSTYGAGRGLMALGDSEGYLEIAVQNGNAARTLGCGVGAPVTVDVIDYRAAGVGSGG
jgi:S-adenosylmethionine hydrolase